MYTKTGKTGKGKMNKTGLMKRLAAAVLAAVTVIACVPGIGSTDAEAENNTGVLQWSGNTNPNAHDPDFCHRWPTEDNSGIFGDWVYDPVHPVVPLKVGPVEISDVYACCYSGHFSDYINDIGEQLQTTGINFDLYKISPYKKIYKRYKSYGDCAVYTVARVKELTGVTLGINSLDYAGNIKGFKEVKEPTSHCMVFCDGAGGEPHVEIIEYANKEENIRIDTSNTDLDITCGPYDSSPDFKGGEEYVCFEEAYQMHQKALADKQHLKEHAGHFTEKIITAPTETKNGKAVKVCDIDGKETQPYKINKLGFGVATEIRGDNYWNLEKENGTYTGYYRAGKIDDRATDAYELVIPDHITSIRKNAADQAEEEEYKHGIGPNGERQCDSENVNKITVNSTKLESIGKYGLIPKETGVRRIDIYLPASRYSDYKQMFKDAGINKVRVYCAPKNKKYVKIVYHKIEGL